MRQDTKKGMIPTGSFTRERFEKCHEMSGTSGSFLLPSEQSPEAQGLNPDGAKSPARKEPQASKTNQFCRE